MREAPPRPDAVENGWRGLARTIGQLRAQPAIGWFLLAYWLYIDGVHTIIRMAVDFGLSLGFDSSSLITALLLVQFVGFPAAIAFGRLGERWGTRKAILLALAVYIVVTVWGTQMQTVAQFYVLAAVLALVQGGIQSLSRSYFGRLVPVAQAGSFFGLYNMMGKFAAVLGPLAVGVTAAMTGSARMSLLSLLVFFVIGGCLLLRVPDPDTTADAQPQ